MKNILISIAVGSGLVAGSAGTGIGLLWCLIHHPIVYGAVLGIPAAWFLGDSFRKAWFDAEPAK